MPSVASLPQAEIDQFQTRLRRIEGQARGIQKMFDEGRDCLDVLNQLASIKAAVNGLSGELLEAYLLRCVQHPDEFGSVETAVEEAVKALVRAGR